jgi:hypothetical protein
MLKIQNEWLVHGFSFANYLSELGAKAQSDIYSKSSVDLALRDAFRKMHKFLMTTKKLTEHEATSLITVGVDFGITQVVDGNWGERGFGEAAAVMPETGVLDRGRPAVVFIWISIYFQSLFRAAGIRLLGMPDGCDLDDAVTFSNCQDVRIDDETARPWDQPGGADLGIVRKASSLLHSGNDLFRCRRTAIGDVGDLCQKPLAGFRRHPGKAPGH